MVAASRPQGGQVRLGVALVFAPQRIGKGHVLDQTLRQRQAVDETRASETNIKGPAILSQAKAMLQDTGGAWEEVVRSLATKDERIDFISRSETLREQFCRRRKGKIGRSLLWRSDMTLANSGLLEDLVCGTASVCAGEMLIVEHCFREVIGDASDAGVKGCAHDLMPTLDA